MKKEAETGIKVQIHHDARDSRPAAMTSTNQVHNGMLELKGVKHSQDRLYMQKQSSLVRNTRLLSQYGGPV